MASYKDNQDFVKTIFSGYPLDDAIDYIQSHFLPQDIFDEDILIEWGEENINKIIKNDLPDDLFENSELEKWALENGFIKND